MLGSARVTLKQYRFEVDAAALAALVLGVSALIVAYRLGATNVPPGCFEAVIGGDAPPAAACKIAVDAFASIDHEEADRVLAAVAVLPFALGLLGGIPIVARELEGRTAQTAWSLFGSRRRWLIRQVAPVLLVLGIAVSFAALAASILEGTREPLYQASHTYDAFRGLGLHGPLVVIRAFGIFGIGLLFGALDGRSIPALVYGVILSIGLAIATQVARDAWLQGQPTVVIADACCTQGVDWHGQQMGRVWLTSGGDRLTDDVARARVPAGVSEPDTWLADHGYRWVDIGVTEEVGLRWGAYDALGFGLVGAGSLVAGVAAVSRRRPT
jgi:hypothetical protein